ncbi:hypothetical protein [Paludisphaera mucosa]|uniref:Uncharacterized protein n=1 Tax=Paludisphaera mucosa TaxID=3030827 RepID=A0ABT6FHR5_9BACT|nr:hypothetical protein [Paludisphaera mucosa]MDG3007089.1 hypothetical protein [Paludisphaera mucosa]
MHRLPWGRGVLQAATGRGPGAFGFACLAAGLILGPCYLTATLEPERTDQASSVDPSGGRSILRAELLECWASEECDGLARAVEETPGPPTVEMVRRLMEDHGCTGLRYVLRVRWLLSDGGFDEITYVRRPYQEPWCFQEFLKFLRQRIETAKGSHGDVPLRVVDLASIPEDHASDSILERLLTPTAKDEPARRLPGDGESAPVVGAGRFKPVPAPRRPSPANH